MERRRKHGRIEFAGFSAGGEISEPAQIRRYIGYAIRRAQMRVYDDFYAALADQDTTPTRFTLMLLIRENPGIRSVDLARLLGVARSGMVRLIDELDRRGLVSRETDRYDRRNLALVLTRLGHRRLSSIEKAVQGHESRMTCDLSASERDTLLELLWRVAVVTAEKEPRRG